MPAVPGGSRNRPTSVPSSTLSTGQLREVPFPRYGGPPPSSFLTQTSDPQGFKGSRSRGREGNPRESILRFSLTEGLSLTRYSTSVFEVLPFFSLYKETTKSCNRKEVVLPSLLCRKYTRTRPYESLGRHTTGPSSSVTRLDSVRSPSWGGGVRGLAWV